MPTREMWEGPDVARLFGLKFLAARPHSNPGETQRWSVDAPLDIPRARDLLEFSYPPESAFAQPDGEELSEL